MGGGGGCVKSGYAGALKSGRFSLSYKANKCSDAGAGDFGVLTTNDTLFMKMTNG